MTTPTSLLLGMTLLSGAVAPRQPAPVEKPPTTVVPGFRVQIIYSDKARAELKRRQETVVILGYPFGFPAKSAPRNIVSKQGEIGIADDLRAEIQPGQVANIPTLTLDGSNFKYLTAAGIQILINVVSGRKSSPDNLLNCDIYEGPLKKVQGQAIPIHCKLIGE